MIDVNVEDARGRLARRLSALTVVCVLGCAPAGRGGTPPAPAPAPPAADSVRADSVRADSVRADSVRRAERSRADSLRAADAARTARARADSARADSVRKRDSLRVAERRRAARQRGAPAPRVARARVAGDLRVCAGGDVTLGTNLDTTWVATASRRARQRVPALPAPGALLAPLRTIFGDADLALVNVEGAIGEGPAPRKCGPGSSGCFAMRQPVATADALRSLLPSGTVVGNVANNHSRDAGAAGFDSTLAHLTASGVLVAGADTIATPIPLADGDTAGVLGFGVSPRGPDARDLAAVRRHVGRAAERYGRVIVTVHMGAEGAAAQRTRRGNERYYRERRGNPVAFADAAVGAGAALVVGHGPHVLRAVEWRDSALVAYSLGNLVTHGPFVNREPLNRGAVLCASLPAAGGVVDAELRPTVQRRAGQVAADRSRRALVLVDSLGRLDFPRTRARVLPDGRLERAPRVERRAPGSDRARPDTSATGRR
ncbi:MAG: CapA family protein [Gemmatimonadaceae bacterium]